MVDSPLHFQDRAQFNSQFGLQSDFADSHQQTFHQRWNHLVNPHVRALAWLLDAPDLLDLLARQWHGKVAILGPMSDDVQNWVTMLDQTPDAINAVMAQSSFRLGLYAEKLMAFYFTHQNRLLGHGVQVRSMDSKAVRTIGEFDFLLRAGAGHDTDLTHWEFATKFYLWVQPPKAMPPEYCFVGPNLADSLGAKMHKILEQQLALSRHPAAQVNLPGAVTTAQALIKGWLFYPDHDSVSNHRLAGVSAQHCYGYWCKEGAVADLSAVHYAILPRLAWLAPAKVMPEQSMSKLDLQTTLAAHFGIDASPVLVAELMPYCGWMLETRRRFIVPDDWQQRAEQRFLDA
ncbi:MAG: DUF1853 family protein [Pseudomonadota bacterium]